MLLPLAHLLCGESDIGEIRAERARERFFHNSEQLFRGERLTESYRLRNFRYYLLVSVDKAADNLRYITLFGTEASFYFS